MSGLVCLQGGGEFSVGCRPMDAEVLRRVGQRPTVVVTALAGTVGRDAQTAEANGVRHYAALGAHAVAAPDARVDPDGALAALASADLVVLPGGSPSRLLDALQQTPVGAWLVEAVAAGTPVSGSSAGAMVLCAWTVLPDRGGPDGPPVVPGLGLVPGAVVVPHWSGGRADWLRAVEATVPAGTQVLGLPEESGLLVEGARLTAVGVRAASLVSDGLDLAVGASGRLGLPGAPTAS